ncbi:purine-nucleoside phosphorylase [Peptoniphilus sp. oral taxon 386]|uniref:purine-nucleoside phosphorylase n=1 Tax=Peptoniphilus sp. oral taxon 386 TaxID=652713 RepID=UPI0001DA9BEF|nr:purine-nucleoside phosphorylase [Peptoniphilus sp. oral taxon 386]EFI42594.1 purine nucleoside phosphorylase [Peptoniphilus sp. oral taxon 386 str. F0131]
MTPHINAKDGAFAKTVLMPGDPLRAKFIAENFLTDAKLVTNVRNMLGYTGAYNGKEVSVMGSGMGIPSIGIYSYELIKFYGVENLIRVGSCGAYSKDLELFDIVLAQGASTNSNYQSGYNLNGNYSALADFDLLLKAYNSSLKLGITPHVGNVLSSDIFYHDNPEEWKNWAKMNILAVEMESYALYANAQRHGAKALTILTVSDSLVTHKETTSEEREKSFTNMMEIALNI